MRSGVSPQGLGCALGYEYDHPSRIYEIVSENLAQGIVDVAFLKIVHEQRAGSAEFFSNVRLGSILEDRAIGSLQ